MGKEDKWWKTEIREGTEECTYGRMEGSSDKEIEPEGARLWGEGQVLVNTNVGRL